MFNLRAALKPMKSLFPFFLLLPMLSIGQNYQPIYSNSLQVFYQETPMNSWSEQEDQFEYNMWGTRVDSSLVVGSVDTFLFNYPIARDTVEEFDPLDYGSCLWVAPNWTGSACWTDNLNNINFVNQENDTISINYGLEIGESMLAYTYHNGDSLLAVIDSIYWFSGSWISDSVKSFSFHRYSGGVEVSDIISSTRIKLLKSNGILQTLDFYRFPHHLVPIYRVDLNTIIENQLPYRSDGPEIDEYRPSPTVGDSYYLSQGWVSVAQGQFSSGTYPFSWEVLAIDTLMGDSGLEVTINRSSPDTSDSYTYLYEPVLDTTNITLVHYDFPNSDSLRSFFPREMHAAYYYQPSQDGCPSTVRFSTCNAQYFENQLELVPDSCLDIEYTLSCHSGINRIFCPYIGYISFYGWNNDSGFIQSESKSYSYYRIGDVECGTYGWVNPSVNELDQDYFQLYPNPTTDQFTVETKSSIKNLSVCNPQGQLIHSNPDRRVDCSTWPPGIYLVRFETENGISTQKLIVQ